MTTVIYGLAKNCGACTYFKAAIEERVTKLYASFGATVEKKMAETVAQGFDANDSRYGFMSEITFFPCIILVKTLDLEAYRRGTLGDGIFSKLSIWNGMVIPKVQGKKRIVPMNPGKYGISDNDFRKFYEAFSSPVPSPQVAAEHSKSQSSFLVQDRSPSGISRLTVDRNAQRMHRCGGIKPIPTIKK